MDYERELNHLQKELDKVIIKIETTSLTVAALQATHKEQYETIVHTLQQVKTDMQELSAAVRSLESLATQGKTSLKTLLWLGGLIAAFITFIINFWFNK
jgi:chromosome segregation ATPase